MCRHRKQLRVAPMMRRLNDCYLYAFVDAAFLNGRPVDEVARQLCDGGADLIQLRAKGASPAAVKAMAEAILPVTTRAGIGLVVNDHAEIAAEVGASYCHLGQEDFFDGRMRHVSELAGFRDGVGLSSHAPEQALRAMAAGAAYLGVGPVYATQTKPGAKPATLDYVRWAAAHVTIPWFAIGGINQANLESVLEAGARRICVVSAILAAPDIVQACQAFRKRLGCA